jgi:glycosyltransferase involved in cell wall biosynthesis
VETNSGDLRLVEIMRVLIADGCSVTLLSPGIAPDDSIRSVEADGVVCIHDREFLLLDWRAMTKFASEGRYDVAVLETYRMFNQYERPLRTALPKCALVLDTVDLHALRLRREAELLGGEDRWEEARKTAVEEGAAVRDADAVWVVTGKEKEAIDPGCMRVVDVIPNIHRVETEVLPWDERGDIVFLGAYGHLPNVDAVLWFVDAVWPVVMGRLPGVSLIVAGRSPPVEIEKLNERCPGVKVVGFVEDHRELLGKQRVGIAPLRYGAGMKGKIGEYLCCGLPCVTTTIGAEGMGFTDGKEVAVCDDPVEFACAVVRLYEDADEWRRMSDAGLAFMRRYSPDAIRPRLLGALERAISERRRRTMWWKRAGSLVASVLRRSGERIGNRQAP